MYGIIYTVHVPLCSIHFLISLIDKRSSFPMLYNPTFLYTFVFSISWLLKPAMYAYKYRLAFLSETNRWLSINYQTKKVCLCGNPSFLNLRACYLTSITLAAFSLSSGVRFGNSIVNTPSFTFASILSLSTSSGRINVCWNLE